MPASRRQEHWNGNTGGGVLDSNTMGVNDTFLQFTSCHFPAFETSSLNDITEWPLMPFTRERYDFSFDSLLGTDVEDNCNS